MRDNGGWFPTLANEYRIASVEDPVMVYVTGGRRIYGDHEFTTSLLRKVRG